MFADLIEGYSTGNATAWEFGFAVYVQELIAAKFILSLLLKRNSISGDIYEKI